MHADIKAIYRLDNTGDAWGDCMAHWFAIAETLDAYGEPTPAEWQFRPSPLRPDINADHWPGSEYRDLIDEDVVSLDDLLEAGRVFNRYASILRAQGRDY